MFTREYGMLSGKNFPEKIGKNIRRMESKGQEGKLCKAFWHTKKLFCFFFFYYIV